MLGLSSETDELTESAVASGEVMTEKELRDLQKNNIVKALKRTNWKVSGAGGAAELLGIRPTTLADRIHTMNIRKPSTR
jgi:transcriptional regulator with GAF, ATPase, and Fis domain